MHQVVHWCICERLDREIRDSDLLNDRTHYYSSLCCRINDRVISANNISLEGVDYATAVQVIKETVSRATFVHLGMK
jgi:hypothetical protein